MKCPSDYGEGAVWHVVVAMDFAADGRMRRDTRYYVKDFDPAASRATFTDPHRGPP